MGKWVKLDMPDRFQMGPTQIAERGGFQLRENSGGTYVCCQERYLNLRPRLLEASRLAESSNADDLNRFRQIAEWPAQDEFRSSLDGVRPHVEAVIATPSSPKSWPSTYVVGRCSS